MAQVHGLPVRLEGEAARRLTEDLVAVLQAGGDPGPRRHQIAVLRQSIRAALGLLPGALTRAAGTLPADDPRRCASEDAVRHFMDEIEALFATVDLAVSTDRPPPPCRSAMS